MAKVSKYTDEQIKVIASTVLEFGPTVASRELAKIGISITVGCAYHWCKKVYGAQMKRVRKTKSNS